MNCKVCNTENADDAKFCRNCGERLAEAPAPAPAKATSQPHPLDWKRLLNLIAVCTAMLGIVLMFTLTFFMACEITMSGSGSIGGAAGTLLQDASAAELYYFFGRGYTEVNEMLAASPNGLYSGFSEISLRLPIIFGTVISALILIGMTVCTAFTVYHFVHFLKGKGGKPFGKWAVITFFTYLMSASAFLNLQVTAVRVTAPSTTPTTIAIAMNAATITGITFGAICIGLYLLAQMGFHAKEYFTKDRLKTLVCSIGGVVCFSVVAGTLTAVPLAIAGAQSGTSVSMTVGFLPVPALLVTDATVVPENGIATMIFAIVAQVLSYALIAVSLLQLHKFISNLFQGTNDSGIGLSITSLALATVYTVLSLLTYNALLSVLNTSALIFSVHFGTLIVTDLFVLFGATSSFLAKLFVLSKDHEIQLPPIE